MVLRIAPSTRFHSLSLSSITSLVLLRPNQWYEPSVLVPYAQHWLPSSLVGLRAKFCSPPTPKLNLTCPKSSSLKVIFHFANKILTQYKQTLIFLTHTPKSSSAILNLGFGLHYGQAVHIRLVTVALLPIKEYIQSQYWVYHPKGSFPSTGLKAKRLWA